MLKFDFALQTKTGQKIESVVIAGKDQADAERKLLQMYHHCTILSCHSRLMHERLGAHSSVEDIVDLISKEN